MNPGRKIQAGIIQQSNSPHVEENMQKLKNKIEEAAQGGAELIVLQELQNSLYFCQSESPENFDLAETIPGPSTDFFADLAQRYSLVIVASLFEKRAPGLYHNTAVVLDRDGTMAGKYRKMHIPDDPGYYEKYYFTPGDLGFIPIETSMGKLGVLVCWDQWYPEAARLMALAGAEILIYPTAIGWDRNDPEDERVRQIESWITIQRSHAIANGIPLISVNRTGYEQDSSGATGGIEFWGNSFVVGPQGEFMHRCQAQREEMAIVSIDMERSEEVRRTWPFLRDRRIDAFHDLCRRFKD